MIDQIIAYILSPLIGDGYKAGGAIKTHPLVPNDIVVRGFIIDSETGALEEIKSWISNKYENTRCRSLA